MRRTRLLPLLALLAAAPAWAHDVELPRLPEPAGIGRLMRPAATVAPPLVIMLPDALGEDGRSEPYVGSLLARGIATLVLGLGEDADNFGGPGTEPAASPGAVAPAVTWARKAGFGRVGLLGFGLGGRAALASEGPEPAAALYPGCGPLPALRAIALVLQGADAARGCDGPGPASQATIRLLPGAGHAWDAPGAIWPSPGPVLPDPAGEGWLRARADLDTTLLAAEAVADWFEALLLAEHRSAAR